MNIERSMTVNIDTMGLFDVHLQKTNFVNCVRSSPTNAPGVDISVWAYKTILTGK